MLGMQLFGNLVHGKFINANAHFCSFPRAMLTMFRSATGEDWNGLMHDAMASPETSDCTYEAGDCGSWVAVPFFVSYVLLTTFIVLKMLIALILENYLKVRASPNISHHLPPSPTISHHPPPCPSHHLR